MTPGDIEMIQNIIPINKSVPHDIFDFYIKEDEFKCAHKNHV